MVWVMDVLVSQRRYVLVGEGGDFAGAAEGGPADAVPDGLAVDLEIPFCREGVRGRVEVRLMRHRR